MGTTYWKGSVALVEDPSSPEWSYGASITVTRVFMGPYAVAKAAAPLKGALGTGDAAGLRVSESRVKHLRGGIGQLTIIYETSGQPAQGATLPADEISIERNNRLERALYLHPRYETLTRETIQAIRDAVESGDEARRKAAEDKFKTQPLAVELLGKLARGFTHYVIYPPSVKITSYHWQPPAPSGGGFRQAPPNIAVTLPTELDWLREGDALSYNGTHWVWVRAWIGAPDLDPEIYPA